MEKSKKRKCHFNDQLKKEFPFLISKRDTIVFCNVCRGEFCIAVGGRAAVTKHLNTNKHKQSLDASVSTSKVTIFFKTSNYSEDEKQLAVMEGTFAFHTIIHSQSFRSMDCTTKLLKKFHNAKFSCARTKCEAIIKSVFKNYCDTILAEDLKNAKFVTILSDASNHNEIKLYPILVRYYNVTKGIQVKILNLESIEGETAEILSNRLYRVINENNLKSKVVALTADNTNTNFGGRRRKGVNNVYVKLQDLLQRKIRGIGCNAHILSNAINTASCAMPIDVEVIITTIYLYFSRFTVRVATLKQFCEDANVEYKKLLGYSKVRWLALTPAIERVLQLFEPLRSYFLSLEKYPKILESFFNNELSEILMYFVHNQASIFHKTIKKIEGENISATEVSLILNDFVLQYKSRYEENFVPLLIKRKLSNLEESNPGVTDKFIKEIQNFYQTCFQYVEEWSETNMTTNNSFQWCFLTSSEVNWADIEKCVEFLSTEMPDIKIDDNALFDEIRRLNLYLNSDKLDIWKNQYVEIDKRWVEIFNYFKKEHIPYENLAILVEFVLSCPGTNAAVERVFSIGNDFWTSEKSRLNIDTLAAALTVKFNLKDISCSEISHILLENDMLTKNIHSMEKYSFN